MNASFTAETNSSFASYRDGGILFRRLEIYTTNLIVTHENQKTNHCNGPLTVALAFHFAE